LSERDLIGYDRKIVMKNFGLRQSIVDAKISFGIDLRMQVFLEPTRATDRFTGFVFPTQPEIFKDCTVMKQNLEKEIKEELSIIDSACLSLFLWRHLDYAYYNNRQHLQDSADTNEDDAEIECHTSYYVCVVVHFLDSWSLKSRFLKIVKIDGSWPQAGGWQVAQLNVGPAVEKIVNQWNIRDKVCFLYRHY
jgi:hypothetical protein